MLHTGRESGKFGFVRSKDQYEYFLISEKRVSESVEGWSVENGAN